MRCLALARAWKAYGGTAFFILEEPAPWVTARLRESGFDHLALPKHTELPEELEVLKQGKAAHPSTLLVLDGYKFNTGYQRAIKTLGVKILAIDDCGFEGLCPADILLNQNVGAEQIDYRCSSATVKLLGAQYVMLRDEFDAWRTCPPIVCEAGHRVLVTMGGDDECNMTQRVVDVLSGLERPGLEARILIGGSNPHGASIARACEQHSGFDVLENVTDMAKQMAWADVAVAAGGTTCYELAFMGLPALVTIMADNQERSVAELAAAGIVVNLGTAEDLACSALAQGLEKMLSDKEARQRMGERGRNLIDGNGKDRVLDALNVRFGE